MHTMLEISEEPCFRDESQIFRHVRMLPVNSLRESFSEIVNVFEKNERVFVNDLVFYLSDPVLVSSLWIGADSPHLLPACILLMGLVSFFESNLLRDSLHCLLEILWSYSVSIESDNVSLRSRRRFVSNFPSLSPLFPTNEWTAMCSRLQSLFLSSSDLCVVESVQSLCIPPRSNALRTVLYEMSSMWQLLDEGLFRGRKGAYPEGLCRDSFSCIISFFETLCGPVASQ